MSKKDIAKAINVDLSTIYRELKRNSGSRNHYNWETAEANARRKKRRTPGNRRISQEVREEALRLLKELGYTSLKSWKRCTIIICYTKSKT